MAQIVKVEFVDDAAHKTPVELDARLEAEVDRFSTYMSGLADPKARGALAPFERAMVKSYLVFKLSGKDVA